MRELEGTKSCRIQGESVRPICMSVHLSVCLSSYGVINCNYSKWALYCRVIIGFREVHNQFPVSNIVTVLPWICLFNLKDDLICLAKV